MAISAQAEAPARGRALALKLTPAFALGSLVAVSVAGRLVVAWLTQTPVVFPDEYIYSELGRSLATTGEPLIRGHAAHFPSLLGPLLEAPAWLVHDVSAAYRIVQALQALAMSLAAVPAYLLARRLRLSTGAALVVAAAAVCLPDNVYSSLVISEAFSYPLVLAALLAGVAALERPAPRTQALFVVLAALATLARIQFVVLPAAYLVAAAGMGLRERRLRRALLEQRLVLGLIALGGVALAVVGLGYYAQAAHNDLSPSVWLRPGAENMLVDAYAVGFGIVPGALLGYGFALARPRGRRELAFAVLAVAFTLGIFAQAAVYGQNVHERYTFYALPPLVVAFLLYARRGWPRRLLHALLAALLVVVGTLQPLNVIGLKGEVNAPVLIALHWLSLHTASPGAASLIALVAVTAIAAGVVALSRAPRAATAFALAATVAVGAVTYGVAGDFFVRNAADVRTGALPADLSWVDSSGVGPLPLVQSFGGSSPNALEQLFWNRSLDRVLLLPGAKPFDLFSTGDVDVARDGALSVDGRPLTGQLVVDHYKTTLVLRGARDRGGFGYYHLWTPTTGPLRLVSYFAGRFSDGWLAPWARLDVWTAGPGTVRLRVSLPARSPATTLRVAVAGGKPVSYRLRPGRARTLALPVCKAGRWHSVFEFDESGRSGGRTVSAEAGMARFTPGAAACPAK